MSFNSNKGNKKTSKEAEVLARQRQVAAQMASRLSSSAKHSSKDAAVKKKPTGVIDLTTPHKPSRNFKRPTNTSIAKQRLQDAFRESNKDEKVASVVAKKQKRPTIRNKPPPPPTSAAAAIAAARSRVAKVTRPNNDNKKKKVQEATKIDRKSDSSKLASLIKNVQHTAVASGTASNRSSSSYGIVEPDDFWKNMRDWDFLQQLQKERANVSGTTDKSSSLSNSASTAISKPLPDTFVSHRHYISAWAPLCLNEARAQLLSEAMQNIPYWNRKGNAPVPVTVTPLNKDVGGILDCLAVKVQSKDSTHNNDPSFMANDIVLLVTRRDILDEAISGSEIDENYGRDIQYRNYGLVGHTEHRRDRIDGLILKVSKKWWAKTGSEHMVLLKIGCNITALREFTALCRIETLPLQRYLLGQDLDTLHKKQMSSKTKMLHKMEGSGKLGKGFMEYARKKFNASQISAISASATEYGEGGFTLIKGPPGTGKTTTLVALLNSLHIRQFNKYYEDVRKIATMPYGGAVSNRKVALNIAAKSKPRLLVCAPSNAAVDNVILKIMEDGFVDGRGKRYNPSIVRVGVGQSDTVKDVSLEAKVDEILAEYPDVGKIESCVAGYSLELQRIQNKILRLRQRMHAIEKASPWPLAREWEIRVDDNFDETKRVYFVNHKEKRTTYEVPPPPEPDEKQYESKSQPEYVSYIGQTVKMVESYNSISSKIEQCSIVKGAFAGGRSANQALFDTRQQLEGHVLDSVHIVMTTLGTAGNRVLESSSKFEVVVVDEAAQSVEPATLTALQLGSSHAILVGDPQQLPATIFSVSGRNTKYDRSLFQRLEEAGHQVYMLNTQYRMNPKISEFPRQIFYSGELLDGPNVKHPEYGNPLRKTLLTSLKEFQPFLVFDLDSREERGGTSLSNPSEAHFCVHLYSSLRKQTHGISAKTRVAVITPYSQQAALLRRYFAEHLGQGFKSFVEVNTVDAFQGREANIVIFSTVRASGSKGIGFLSDVRRMNVALTRAKHFLFIVARCESIVVNPYWRDLVNHARETRSVMKVHMENNGPKPSFAELKSLKAEVPPKKAMVALNKRKRGEASDDDSEDGELT